MINTLRNGTPKISRQTMKLDSALVKLLQLDPENTTVSSAGGGGCSSASTSKITSKDQDGREKTFFMKTGKGKEAAVMFEGSTIDNIVICTTNHTFKANTHHSMLSMKQFLHYVPDHSAMEDLNPNQTRRS
jgi:hypothetical protein